MGEKIKLTVDDKKTKRLLRELPIKVTNKGLRQSVNAGATPVLKQMRKEVPEESGLMKKSLIKKTKLYKKNGVAISVIGADKNVVGEFRGRKRVPNKYLHLVTMGHGGPHPAPAHDFVATAYEKSKNVSAAKAQSKLQDVLETEAAKLA